MCLCLCVCVTPVNLDTMCPYSVFIVKITLNARFCFAMRGSNIAHTLVVNDPQSDICIIRQMKRPPKQRPLSSSIFIENQNPLSV